VCGEWDHHPIHGPHSDRLYLDLKGAPAVDTATGELVDAQAVEYLDAVPRPDAVEETAVSKPKASRS
jgi:hypothetical protein